MSIERPNPDRSRGILQGIETAEILALIAEGAAALVINDLVPTVAAIGTIAAMVGWHGYHWLIDGKPNQMRDPLPNEEYHMVEAKPTDAEMDTLEVVRSVKSAHGKIHQDKGNKRNRRHRASLAKRNFR